MAEPVASIIIPTHNKAPYLDLTLASFVGQSRADFEVVVVDDGSTDATAEVVARWSGSLAISQVSTSHRGRAAARNEALQRARAEIVIFSDDDCLASPEFVAAHVAEHSRDAVPRLVIGWQEGVIPRWTTEALLPLESLRRILTRRPELRRLLETRETVELLRADDVLHRFAETVEPLVVFEPWWDHCAPVIHRYGDALTGLHIAWVISATGNLSVPRRLALAAGGFDEGFRGWGLEDLDLAYRIEKQGARPVIGRSAVSYHQVHATSGAASKWAQWLRNLRHFVHKSEELAPALYGHFFTRVVEPDLDELNRLVGESARFAAAAPASARALREALVTLIDGRIGAFRWSGVSRLPFVSW